MGKIVSKVKEPFVYATGSVAEIITGRKRKRDEDDDSEDELSNALEKSLNAPKKKKLLTTTQYIYQALFKEHKNSDVSVMALGKVWHLHKVYLCQSPYFASMFSGSWKESGQDFINIKILDPKITLESLEAVFGSLYIDEVVIEPLAVTSILATATLFQLDGLIDRCTEVMIETTNAETAVSYYEAACQYGIQAVKKASFDWLLTNLLSLYTKHLKWLKLINIDLMTKLISSQDLFVMQTEFTLYSMLRTWLFLQFYPSYELSSVSFSSANNSVVVKNDLTPENYFSSRKDKTPFLHMSQGREYQEPFQALRVQHLLNHHIDFKLTLEDNIIPKEWLQCHLLSHWNSILKIDHSLETGPGEVDSQLFYKNCMRCGRVLQEQGYQKWRWTGFNFGLDLVLIADKRVLRIKRHHRAEHERMLSLQTKRQFLIRVTVASLNALRQVAHRQITELKSLTLEKNEETSLMLMDRELEYPLLISVNLLVVPLGKQLTQEDIEVAGEGTSNQTLISEIGANEENNNSGCNNMPSSPLNRISSRPRSI